MAADAPLSTLLSQVLIAHTMEVDNAFERALMASGESARVTSLVMWSNFLRSVGDGLAVGELPEAVGLPKARVLSNLGGMERWRYVFVAPADTESPPEERRGGWGSARGLESAWVVRPTGAGRFARTAWPTLLGEVDRGWEARFGTETVRELRSRLQTIVGALDVELPRFLPVVASSDGFAVGLTPGPRKETSAPAELSTLLAQALLAYALDFERDSELSLTLASGFVRILEPGLLVRDVPDAAGVSKEATSAALTALVKGGHAVVTGTSAGTKRVMLTPAGAKARARCAKVHARVAREWAGCYGDGEVRGLTAALERILEHPRLTEGLRPDPSGWRATRPYAARTEALLAAPRALLPHHPVVLHRGGWPDGS
jgi:hypothetical protein